MNSKPLQTFFPISTTQILTVVSLYLIIFSLFLSGLQYAYLNSEENPGKKSGDTEDLAKASRSEITLDELDDLYRSEEAEKEAELASKRLMMASHSNLVTSIKVNSATPPPVVRMRSRDDMRFNNNKSSKKINRLSRKLPFLLNFFSPPAPNSFDLGALK